MKYLITSALPYINGIKHLGNIVGSMLPADVYARFSRQQGHEVLYICGTDDHGTPAEIAAEEAGMPVEVFCAKMHAVQSNIYQQFAISFDYFGRSSSETNKIVTQQIFKELDENGLILEKALKQIYSLEDKRFLPDRYVIGTCPKCGFDKARGDQCDQCGSLLDPTDLINPRSAISGSTQLELRESKHLYLDLPKQAEKVRAWVDAKAEWPPLSKSVAYKWLNEGLHARCITRDLRWGVPVPKAGFEDKVFYVWFDAPMAYIAITMDWAVEVKKDKEAWKRYWLADQQNTSYVQFMAKDNLPFHAIIWPAMLLGSNENWKTVDILKGFHWLTYEGGKFSTSQNRGIFSDVALTLFPADYWRYYLLARIPESQDSDFYLADFIGVINKDLVGILGNFINRVAALISKYCDNVVPPYEAIEETHPLYEKCQTFVKAIAEDLQALSFRSAMKNLREFWVLGNEYITGAAPWKVAKENREAAGNILATCLHFIRMYAIVTAPIMPQAAEKIFHFLNEPALPADIAWHDAVQFSVLKSGAPLNEMGLLFAKISEEEEKRLKEKFAV